MHTSLHYRMGGLGAAAGAQTGVAIGATGAEAALPLFLAPNLVPIVGAAIAGIAILASRLIANSGCGQTCIQSSEYANQAGDLMAKNLNAYLALAAPRPKSVQMAALQTFDALWAQLVNLCTNDPLLANTTAGRNCIADRQAGACKWRASPGGWVQSTSGGWTYKGGGPAGSGTNCWNYFIGFRDPIANDPSVVDDTQPPVAPVPVGAVPVSGVPSTTGIAAPGVGALVALVAGGLLLYTVMS